MGQGATDLSAADESDFLARHSEILVQNAGAT
jgi:hypothetical protein